MTDLQITCRGTSAWAGSPSVSLHLLPLSQAAKRQARKQQQQDAAAATPAAEAQPAQKVAEEQAAPGELAAAAEQEAADEPEAASELGAEAAEAAGLEDDDSATSDATEAAAPAESLPDGQQGDGFAPAKLKRRRSSKAGGAALDATGGTSTPGMQSGQGTAGAAAEQQDKQQRGREESDEQLARRLQVGCLPVSACSLLASTGGGACMCPRWCASACLQKSKGYIFCFDLPLRRSLTPRQPKPCSKLGGGRLPPAQLPARPQAPHTLQGCCLCRRTCRRSQQRPMRRRLPGWAPWLQL